MPRRRLGRQAASPKSSRVMTFDLHEEYAMLGAFYDAAEAVVAWPDADLFRVNPEVSAWSPARHLFHILRADGMMLKGIHLICQGHRLAANEGAPNEAGRALLTQGRFPRGRVQAPESVVPPAEVSRGALEDSLARSRRKYAETEAFLPQIPAATGRMPHFYLGMLNAAEWLRLTRVHSEHHYGIMQDIVGQQETV